MKMLKSLFTKALTKAPLVNEANINKLKAEQYLCFIKDKDINSVKQILKKEVCFKAYILINQIMTENIELLKVNVHPFLELTFQNKDNTNNYSILPGKTEKLLVSGGFPDGVVKTGLYKRVVNNFSYKRESTYSDRISLNDDTDQELFWIILVRYVKNELKRIEDEREALIQKEEEARNRSVKEQIRLAQVERKKQEEERLKRIEQDYFS